MKAQVVHEFGPLQNLAYQDFEEPVAQAGQVLIGVEAAGLNFPDLLMIEGKISAPARPPVRTRGGSGGEGAGGGGGSDRRGGGRPGDRLRPAWGDGGKVRRPRLQRVPPARRGVHGRRGLPVHDLRHRIPRLGGPGPPAGGGDVAGHRSGRGDGERGRATGQDDGGEGDRRRRLRSQSGSGAGGGGGRDRRLFPRVPERTGQRG